MLREDWIEAQLSRRYEINCPGIEKWTWKTISWRLGKQKETGLIGAIEQRKYKGWAGKDIDQ